MPDPVVDIANQLNSVSNNENLPYTQMRFGLVTAINPADNTCTIQLSGDTSLNIPGVKALNNFQPTVNDNVCCLKQGTDVVVIGKFQSGTFNAYAQAQNFVTANNVITTSGVFFDLSSTPNSVSMTKRYSTSNLFVNLAITGWADVISGGMITAVQIFATDYICGSVTMDRLVDSGGDTALRSARLTAVGSTVISGLGAGAITAKIRIKNNVAGSNLHVDTGDYYSLTIQEVL